jgi:hypothetical protein
MDYFQGVVTEYLRADRALFVNPEYFFPLVENDRSPRRGTSWYVDLVATSFREQVVYLCEVTYASGLSALLKRLSDWADNWPALVNAIHRDSYVPATWKVRPWIFVPEDFVPRLLTKMPALPVSPRITTLEMTQPWRYPWDRCAENAKPEIIPEAMRH